MTKKLNFKYIAPIITFAFVTSAFTPAKDTFTAAEQQQISITTPGLFSRSNTFSIDLSTLKAGDYVFPLPVGKAELTDNSQALEIKTKECYGVENKVTEIFCVVKQSDFMDVNFFNVYEFRVPFMAL